MGQLAADLSAALVAAGLTASPVRWSGAGMPSGVDGSFVFRFDGGEQAGPIDGTGITADAHDVVIECLLSAGAQTPVVVEAAALDRVSLIRRALDIASPGTSTWAGCRYRGYTLGDLDVTWRLVSVRFTMYAAFNHAVNN